MLKNMSYIGDLLWKGTIQIAEGKWNFIVEKPDKYYLSQEIKIKLVSDKLRGHILDDENGIFPLCSS